MSPKNWPRITVTRQVFSVLISAYFPGPVNLKHTVYPSTSTLNISKYCNKPCAYHLHTPWANQFPGHENGKQLQVTTFKIAKSKENKSIHRLDLSGSTGLGGWRGGSFPPAPASYGSAITILNRASNFHFQVVTSSISQPWKWQTIASHYIQNK